VRSEYLELRKAGARRREAARGGVAEFSSRKISVMRETGVPHGERIEAAGFQRAT
jgi:hypothetical protein